MSGPVFVIAEAGVNHNGDLDIGRGLIDAAADAGADAVKFQTFRADELVSRDAPKAAYQQRTTGTEESQHEMIRRLELSEVDHRALIGHAATRGIAFLSTPFDFSSLRLLTETFGLGLIKIGSGELTNLPLLLAAARASERLIVSTGMGSTAEVEQALGVVAYGFTSPGDGPPGPGEFGRAFASDKGQAALRERITLLHCTTEYPAAFDDVNLRAIATMSRAFGLPVGYSDHTPGIHIAVAAVACGARMIEKHVTLDRGLPGPDHAASLEPEELHQLVQHIRDVERARGDGVKRPTPAEWRNREVARKSLVAARPITKGEPFTSDNIACKRPGTGQAPSRYWEYLGQPANRDYATDELLE
jgi:N-acetylneuraminate synthase